MPAGKIKLEFTQEQYRNLVQTFCLGKWIAEEDADDLQLSNLENLEQTILSRSGSKEDNAYIIYDTEEDYYSLAEEEEDKLMEQIENYDEAQFWEILVSRLTMRDLHLKYTAKEIEDMPENKGLKVLEEIQKGYFDEFEEHDVDHLKLVKPGKS